MISATSPASTIAVPLATEAKVAARWEEWRGHVAAWLAPLSLPRRVPFNLTVASIQQGHREWLLSLLARNIPMTQIRRLDLDDPRESRSVLMARAERYLERHARSRQYRNRRLTKFNGGTE